MNKLKKIKKKFTEIKEHSDCYVYTKNNDSIRIFLNEFNIFCLSISKKSQLLKEKNKPIVIELDEDDMTKMYNYLKNLIEEDDD